MISSDTRFFVFLPVAGFGFVVLGSHAFLQVLRFFWLKNSKSACSTCDGEKALFELQDSVAFSSLDLFSLDSYNIQTNSGVPEKFTLKSFFEMLE